MSTCFSCTSQSCLSDNCCIRENRHVAFARITGKRMIQGLYSAASSLSAATQHQEIIAHNLAHATVPGYRARGLTFSTFSQNLADASADARLPSSAGTEAAREYSDFTPGNYEATANPLDVAVRGNGFFVLQAPDGPVYTRNGCFELNAEGQLQSKSGLVVSGTGGPITIPQGTTDVRIGKDGTVTAGREQVGQLQIVSFAGSDQLSRVGPTLFAAPPGSAPQPAQSDVIQGYRESSNVSIVQEMVKLIVGTRHYEAATKALRALSDVVQQQTQGQQQS